MPHGANTINNKQNGTKPNQRNRTMLQKLSFPNPKHKTNPTLGFMKSKTKSKNSKD